MAQPGIFHGQRVWLLGTPTGPATPDGRRLLVTSAAGTRLRQVATFADRGNDLRHLVAADGDLAAPSCGPLAAWTRELESLPPGPALWAALARRPDRSTAAADRTAAIRGTAAVYADAILDGLCARRRLMAALDAQEAHDLAALTDAYPGIDQFLPTEVGLALHTNDAKAGRLLDRAHRLVHTLPATTAALAAGQISSDAADALINATATTTPQIAGRVEHAVLPRCPGATYTEIHRAATYRVTKWDADATRKRHAQAVADRHITTRSRGDGMAELSVISTIADIAAIWEALTALADAAKTPADPRTLGARRVDALVDLCTDILEGRLTNRGAETPRLTKRHGRRPRIQVVVPLTTLLGGDTPAELLGHGWISPDQARLLAADAELTRLVCDPHTGVVTDYGHTRYRPPQHLVDLIVARDRTCVMPGCRQPSWRSENDHLLRAQPDKHTGKPTLGTTQDTNLGPLCKHHHLAKDADRGFHVTRNPDGSYTWTTPLGRTHTRPPDDQLGEPDYTPSTTSSIELATAPTSESQDSPRPKTVGLESRQTGADVNCSAGDRDDPPF